MGIFFYTCKGNTKRWPLLFSAVIRRRVRGLYVCVCVLDMNIMYFYTSCCTLVVHVSVSRKRSRETALESSQWTFNTFTHIQSYFFTGRVIHSWNNIPLFKKECFCKAIKQQQAIGNEYTLCVFTWFNVVFSLEVELVTFVGIVVDVGTLIGPQQAYYSKVTLCRPSWEDLPYFECDKVDMK